MIGVFGGQNRRGPWRVGRQLSIIDAFGGSDVDLCDAVVTSPEMTITAVAIFGGSNIRVPEGAEVEMTEGALFGGHDLKVSATAIPGAPRIRVRAFSLFGGVDVTDKPRRQSRPSARPSDGHDAVG